jgi:hypothetical protein
VHSTVIVLALRVVYCKWFDQPWRMTGKIERGLCR